MPFADVHLPRPLRHEARKRDNAVEPRCPDEKAPEPLCDTGRLLDRLRFGQPQRPVSPSAGYPSPARCTQSTRHGGRSGNGPEVHFGVHVRNDNRDRTPPLVRLKALCGPDDDGVPCITVMTPDED
jgi:hypothetical protein